MIKDSGTVLFHSVVDPNDFLSGSLIHILAIIVGTMRLIKAAIFFLVKDVEPDLAKKAQISTHTVSLQDVLY
jgi:hypothetical protein